MKFKKPPNVCLIDIVFLVLYNPIYIIEIPHDIDILEHCKLLYKGSLYFSLGTECNNNIDLIPLKLYMTYRAIE